MNKIIDNYILQLKDNLTNLSDSDIQDYGVRDTQTVSSKNHGRLFCFNTRKRRRVARSLFKV